MPLIHLYPSPPGVRGSLLSVLMTLGWQVREVGEGETPGDAPDLIVAELERVLEQGWARPVARVAAPAPVLAYSCFPAFLARAQPFVSAVLPLPATAEQIERALDEAQGQEPRGRRTAKEPFTAARDAALAAVGLLRPAVDAELSAVAKLVAEGVGLPMGLITVLDSTWQTFLGQSGMPTDLAAACGTPRPWSFCQHVVRERAPLSISDARLHPVLSESPLVRMGLVIAYLGYPIEVEGVGVVGSVCAMGAAPHVFSRAERMTVQLGARLVSQILARRLEKKDVQRERPLPAAPAAPPRLLAPGDLLNGRYWITAKLGEGGQGRVYLGREKELGKLVAIKVSERDHEPTLKVEAETLVQLRHPNIVQVHDRGTTPGGESYMVLEYVEGEGLEERLSVAAETGKRLPPAMVLEIVAQMAGALSTLHAGGFVHGDMKPSNILYDTALDRAVLIDLGLGLTVGGAGLDERGFGGTVGYSAPEQLTPGAVVRAGPTFDVYGLAAVTFQMLAGVGPFESAGSGWLIRQFRGQIHPLSVARPDLPPAVEPLLIRALSVTPSERPASVLAFSEQLRLAMAGAPASPEVSAPPARSRGVAFLAVRRQVRRLQGDEAERRLVASMPEALREALEEATDEGKFYPIEPLAAYLQAYSGGDRARLESLGEKAMGEGVRSALRSLHVARTPQVLAGAIPELLDRFHPWARAQVRVTSSHSARIELALPASCTPILCAFLLGNLRELLTWTGQPSTMKEVQCGSHGSPFCLFDATWTDY